MLNPEFVDIELAIAIHDDLIETHGGSLGVRDERLLESALSQPQATFFGEFLHPTIAEQAAAYLYHVTKNHAFIDGNKRAALGITEAFLRMNGYNLTLSDNELYELVLAVSTGKLEKTDLISVIADHLVVQILGAEAQDC
ncbi:type II toxin-antitoxin system death-on-curing family toxin [Iningainema tapete]|uniref:Type II toxin-antitoxin system death-on-curing family toxin n=1 Tax=Iningainema tapete BLCC-T55 TaxID=2748662 RepID=A0A8J6XEM4_9CYAN|nr:type II toxin-antitoxin system death-on-curing family toxin [Iningainema tapete]MBD2771177.1 type II toxin-antitoxin system death-on-curing family toxin [Iningainema tapete BLCC-T55]